MRSLYSKFRIQNFFGFRSKKGNTVTLKKRLAATAKPEIFG